MAAFSNSRFSIFQEKKIEEKFSVDNSETDTIRTVVTSVKKATDLLNQVNSSKYGPISDTLTAGIEGIENIAKVSANEIPSVVNDALNKIDNAAAKIEQGKSDAKEEQIPPPSPKLKLGM